MKLSYNWLKEYIALNVKPDLLAHKLTMAGLTRVRAFAFGVFAELFGLRTKHPFKRLLRSPELEAGSLAMTQGWYSTANLLKCLEAIPKLVV